MKSEAADDLEAYEPLLQEFKAHLESKIPQSHAYQDFVEFHDDEEDLEPSIDDPMTYKLPWLKAWGVFGVVQGTVWDNRALWLMMGRLSLIMSVCAILSYNVVPDPHYVDVAKFSDMNAALSAFVVLMLGFFLSSAVNRWISCVSGLLGMFNSIKNYSMQLHAFGVSRERITLSMRYCVLSASFLFHDIKKDKLDPVKKAEVDRMFWDYLESGISEYNRIDAKERRILEQVDDRSSVLWIWVASLLARMASDGDLPSMASPAYTHLMKDVKTAQEGQRECRTAIVVQMPLVYLHTLAFLVHVNSLLFAMIAGIAVGTTLHGIRRYLIHYHIFHGDEVSTHVAMNVQPLTSLLQALLVEVVKGFVAPLLFQSFLHIGLSIVSPLEDDDAAIPIRKLIYTLERDLKDARFTASKPPHWDAPTWYHTHGYKQAKHSHDAYFEEPRLATEAVSEAVRDVSDASPKDSTTTV
mmetsp:Transcript_99034/g.171633  ORF Transcript_99034/g.171633 Transcript_99034/m.171633 type:complete len:467 (+) Transcript_99034:89-1489(+)